MGLGIRLQTKLVYVEILFIIEHEAPIYLGKHAAIAISSSIL
jgi:hypothetical protein